MCVCVCVRLNCFPYPALPTLPPPPLHPSCTRTPEKMIGNYLDTHTYFITVAYLTQMAD